MGLLVFCAGKEEDGGSHGLVIHANKSKLLTMANMKFLGREAPRTVP